MYMHNHVCVHTLSTSWAIGRWLIYSNHPFMCKCCFLCTACYLHGKLYIQGLVFISVFHDSMASTDWRGDDLHLHLTFLKLGLKSFSSPLTPLAPCCTEGPREGNDISYSAAGMQKILCTSPFSWVLTDLICRLEWQSWILSCFCNTTTINPMKSNVAMMHEKVRVYVTLCIVVSWGYTHYVN